MDEICDPNCFKMRGNYKLGIETKRLSRKLLEVWAPSPDQYNNSNGNNNHGNDTLVYNNTHQYSICQVQAPPYKNDNEYYKSNNRHSQRFYDNNVYGYSKQSIMQHHGGNQRYV